MNTPVSAASKASKNTVQSLAKGFRVLEAFGPQRPELTLAEVARLADLDNATAFRLLNTLVQLGYVEKLGESRQFRLTFKVMNLGFNALGHHDLRAQARPVLRTLVGEINEAASIGVIDGGEIVYIERVQAGLTRLGIDVRIGSRVPVYSSAIGQALIAWLPREQQISVLESAPRKALTPTTLTAMDDLLQRLEQIRARGYALSNQETVSGVYVIACPILDPDEQPMAAISVATPVFASTIQDFEQRAAGPLMNAARQLSQILLSGGSVAHVGRPAAPSSPV